MSEVPLYRRGYGLLPSRCSRNPVVVRCVICLGPIQPNHKPESKKLRPWATMQVITGLLYSPLTVQAALPRRPPFPSFTQHDLY